MNLQELRTKYSSEQLSAIPGDGELRYKIFTPILTNLYENKVIYRERNMWLAELSDFDITPDHFFVRMKPIIKFDLPYFDFPFPDESWIFGAKWSWLRLSVNCFTGYSGSWVVWPEPELVKAAEQLILKKDFEGALELTEKK